MTETRNTRPNKAYVLSDYDPAWSEKFQAIKPKLAEIFGSNALTIEHIGSTSIPDMVAKPQIDILVLVRNLEKVKSLYGAMELIGFKARGDYVGQQEESFVLDRDGQRLYNVHAMEDGNPEAAMYITLREYLRNNSEARERYIAKKLELYRIHGANDYNSYDFGKEELVKQLKAEARDWQARQ